jgi:hypothetical protein
MEEMRGVTESPLSHRLITQRVPTKGKCYSQESKKGVIAILAVGAECGVLVGGVGFSAQQGGERHTDLRLYQGSGDEQCSQESAGARSESGGLLWWSMGCH